MKLINAFNTRIKNKFLSPVGKTVCVCFFILNSFTLQSQQSMSPDKINQEFVETFKYELANRSLALLFTERMSKRTPGNVEHDFWLAFHKLEEFNQPKYIAMANKLGISPKVSWWTHVRATILGSTPDLLMARLIKAMIKRTPAYIARLKRARELGPRTSKEFLDYMVAQEELQLEMASLLIANKPLEAKKKVDEFLSEQNAVVD